MTTRLKHRWSLGHNYLAGVTAGDWLRLLCANRFLVSPAYWHRAAFITVSSMINSFYRFCEERRFGGLIDQVELSEPPLFILGHWRSGTTLLHYLLAQDQELFTYANTYQVVNPRTFLCSEETMTRRFANMVPPTRPMDNMSLSFTSPQEDEFAPLLLTFYSLYLGISFPRREEFYTRYLTFRDVPEDERNRWKNAFMWFCRKLTYKKAGMLLLKSPAHTSRIRLLLEMFPDARFVHIHRDPYRVFQSQRHFFDTAAWYTYLQKPRPDAIDEGIIRRYELMYDAFFEDLPRIPARQFHEVRFEDLESNPRQVIENVYEQLDLPGFTRFGPVLEEYVSSLRSYKKNEYPELDDNTKALIAERWARSFETWGYSR